jgi:hypothetical protein
MESGIVKTNVSLFQIVAQQLRQPKTVSRSPVLNFQSTMNRVRNYLNKEISNLNQLLT